MIRLKLRIVFYLCKFISLCLFILVIKNTKQRGHERGFIMVDEVKPDLHFNKNLKSHLYLTVPSEKFYV